jgi:hypothetical protein
MAKRRHAGRWPAAEFGKAAQQVSRWCAANPGATPGPARAYAGNHRPRNAEMCCKMVRRAAGTEKMKGCEREQDLIRRKTDRRMHQAS